MMNHKQSTAILDLRFRPRGVGRLANASFLIFWLCGWVVGEVLALLILGHALVALITGRPFMGSEPPPQIGFILFMMGFLLVWLAIWTAGGVLSIRELLRLLWAEDRIQLDIEFLWLTHRLGPFAKTRRLPRGDIRRVFIQPAGTGASALMAQTRENVITLADLGTPEERARASGDLRAALNLVEAVSNDPPATLPDQWQNIMDERGHLLLVPNLRTRRVHARIVSVVAILAWAVSGLLAWHCQRDPDLWVGTIIVSLATLWITKRALWLHRGRYEWRIERGRIIRQRRNGALVHEQIEAHALELTESTDSDNDRWYELKAIGLTLPGHTTRSLLPGRKTAPKDFQIDRTIHDPTGPRRLALWLSKRAQIPFHDRVPDDATRRAETAKALDQLARSGKLGNLLAGWLSRISSPGNDPPARPPENRQDG